MKAIYITPILLLFVFSACDRTDCTNTNSIIANNPINSEVYITEIHNLIAESSTTVRFWFDEYVYENKINYIILHIQSEDICAKGKFLVSDWSGLEGIERTNGSGYRGAEFKGFKYKIDSSQSPKVLSYLSVSRIID